MEEVTDCERVIVMNHGKIAADDTPSEIFKKTSLLHECSLDVPEAVRIAIKIREHGVPISENALCTEKIAEELCQLL